MMERLNAVVEHRGHKRKSGRFSVAELVEAGLSWKDARAAGIGVDKRRSTLYDENVTALKERVKAVKSKAPKKSRATKQKAKSEE
ncbi:hypothetical protein D6783_01985 [Candidatus Woesearchaeota archaeon]|nr:MAG: hypothetical protein D6783_01985 [Candidatus Woesearchaeota archaeon]